MAGQRSLVGLEEQVNNRWAEMQNNYQRRSDLIPSLVNVVRGSSDFEKTTLEQLTAARANANQLSISATPTAESFERQEQVQASVVAGINRVIAVVERYPDLKSTQQYRTLQSQLEGTERRIKFARKDFNEAVMAYNKKVRSFPWNLVSGILGFSPKTGFRAEAGTEAAPEVMFN